MKKGLTIIMSSILGALVGGAVIGKIMSDKGKIVQNQSNNHAKLFGLMNQWVRLKQEKKNVSTYFENNGYKSIAIYGMSYVGQTLLEELKDTKTEVKYAIDRNAEKLYADVSVIKPNGDMEDVDVIVVTAVYYMDEIKEELSTKVSCPIVSLDDILYEI